jgi:hypothetical protein
LNSLPQGDLNKRSLPVKTFAGRLFRSFPLAKGRIPAGVFHFSRAKTERFDDPRQEYGVCYLGLDEAACFIETFGQTKPRVLDDLVIGKRGLAKVRASLLKLVDITAEGAFKIGTAGEVSAGDKAISQQWSRAFYDHPDNVDGILYRARNDLSRVSLALFERAAQSLELETTMPWLDVEHLPEILELYDIAFIKAPVNDMETED